MRQETEADPVDGLKACLRELEQIRLIYPDDLTILRLKRHLRAKIAELEVRRVTYSESGEIRQLTRQQWEHLQASHKRRMDEIRSHDCR